MTAASGYPIVHDGQMYTPDNGRIDPPAMTGSLLNCGHAPREPGSLTPGYALIMDYTVCYDCMDAWERSFMTDSAVFTGYVSNQAGHFTTWTGGRLARITSHRFGPRIRMPYGGSYRPRYVRATDPSGAEWWGRGTDSHDLITLRRVKVRQPAASV